MATDALGPLLDRERMRQVVERVFPDQADEVFRRVEVRGVGRGVEELHGDPLCHGDFRQQLGQAGLHGVAVDAAVVEDEDDPAEPEPGVAQDDEGERQNGVPGLGLGLEVGGGLAAAQVDGQEAVEFLAVLFVAGHLRRGVLRRPRVVRAGRGLEGELVQGYEGGAGLGLLGFFFSASTNSARSPGWPGP